MWNNLSKDAHTTTIYLSEMNFIKTTQIFLRKSGKSRWRIATQELSENAHHIIMTVENVIYVWMKNYFSFRHKNEISVFIYQMWNNKTFFEKLAI